MSTTKKNEEQNSEVPKEIAKPKKDDRPVCGLIMPIAGNDEYPASHWEEVKKIITTVAEEAGFRTRLVSESDSSHIIQKTIVQNVFDDDIVICDVSSKNPNVMFELGLRFAFDKATVIIKDFETGYSFDTSPVEHLNYPKDLRYFAIEDFKIKLAAKLIATHGRSKDPNNSMYLESFGRFEVKSLPTNIVSDDQYIIKVVEELKSDISNLKSSIRAPMSADAEKVRRPYLAMSPDTILQYYDSYEALFANRDIEKFYEFLKAQNRETGNVVPSFETVRNLVRALR